jgi:hypothetical protein
MPKGNEEGDSEASQGADVGDQPEIEQIGEGGAEEPTASTLAQTQAGPSRRRGRSPAVAEEGKQEEDGPYLAAKGHQFGVQAAPLGDPASRQEAGAAVAGGGDEAGQHPDGQLAAQVDLPGGGDEPDAISPSMTPAHLRKVSVS